MRCLRAFLIPFAALPLLLSAGCSSEDSIQQFTVTHEEREPILMRVAILSRPELVWFVRISGPLTLVNEQSAAFEDFVKSMRFHEKKNPLLTWKEPKDWKKDPPSAERYAAFRVDVKGRQIEITVTQLPAEKYSLMSNVHRWEKQLNLPLTEEPDELDAFVKKGMLGDQPVTWVEMKGLGIHTVSKRPDPAGLKKDLQSQILQQRKTEVPFKYTLEEGWVEKPAPDDKITAALIEVAEGDSYAKVTLTPMKGHGGGVAANVQRWRKQVGLPPLELPDAEIAKSAETIDVAGIKSSYVDVLNPKGPAQSNRILGVYVPLRRTTWIVRMSGPMDWVGQNKAAFEQFVKSFRLDAR